MNKRDKAKSGRTYRRVVIVVVLEHIADRVRDFWKVVYPKVCQDILYVEGSRRRRTERHRREEVMCDMVVRHVVEEETADPAEQGAVDGGGDAAQECPLILTVVRDGRVRVMKERAHYDPG